MGIPRSYDKRFRRDAPTELIAALDALPVGSTATIRTVTFRRDTARTWSNDFRTGMTSREVAAVLAEGPHTLASIP